MKFSFILILLIGLVSCNTRTSLKIATSANMQFTLEEIVEEFQKENPIEIDLIVSSTGQLTSQIQHGAPFDLLVAADMKYPKYLFENGFSTQNPEVYAKGRLVLWTLNDIEPSLEVLLEEDVKKISIPNPKTAPYGEVSVALLKQLNIFKTIEHKLIFGESVSQSNQFISTQAVDIGFTSLSIVLSNKLNNKGEWYMIPTNSYAPIPQGVIILNSTTRQTDAQLFYDFLFTTKAKNILKKKWIFS